MEKENSNIDKKEFLELLSLIDFMAAWINNVGGGDYNNGMRHVKGSIMKIREKVEISTRNPPPNP